MDFKKSTFSLSLSLFIIFSLSPSATVLLSHRSPFLSNSLSVPLFFQLLSFSKSCSLCLQLRLFLCISLLFYFSISLLVLLCLFLYRGSGWVFPRIRIQPSRKNRIRIRPSKTGSERRRKKPGS